MENKFIFTLRISLQKSISRLHKSYISPSTETCALYTPVGFRVTNGENHQLSWIDSSMGENRSFVAGVYHPEYVLPVPRSEMQFRLSVRIDICYVRHVIINRNSVLCVDHQLPYTTLAYYHRQ